MSQLDISLYRPCVGVMLVNAEGRAFVGRRIDNKEGDFWQMPQGGVDPGEDPDKAVLRELWEETGAAAEHVEVIARLPQELFYERLHQRWPNSRRITRRLDRAHDRAINGGPINATPIVMVLLVGGLFAIAVAAVITLGQGFAKDADPGNGNIYPTYSYGP